MIYMAIKQLNSALLLLSKANGTDSESKHENWMGNYFRRQAPWSNIQATRIQLKKIKAHTKLFSFKKN